jgi:hypothetical protein
VVECIEMFVCVCECVFEWTGEGSHSSAGSSVGGSRKVPDGRSTLAPNCGCRGSTKSRGSLAFAPTLGVAGVAGTVCARVLTYVQCVLTCVYMRVCGRVWGVDVSAAAAAAAAAAAGQHHHQQHQAAAAPGSSSSAGAAAAGRSSSSNGRLARTPNR